MGQLKDKKTGAISGLYDFVGLFDVLEEHQDNTISEWYEVNVERLSTSTKRFEVKGNQTNSILLKEYGEKECGIGAGCWLSSIAMMSYITKNHKLFKGKNVLEIGCGTALNSLYLASNVQDTNITSSDYKETIGMVLQENTKLNQCPSIDYKILDWQKCCEDNYEPESTIGKYDIIIATDCIYKSTANIFQAAVKMHLKDEGKLLMINPVETSRPGVDNFIYTLAERGEVAVKHIAIRLNKNYTKPLLFVEFTA